MSIHVSGGERFEIGFLELERALGPGPRGGRGPDYWLYVVVRCFCNGVCVAVLRLLLHYGRQSLGFPIRKWRFGERNLELEAL